jgi:hypothetical protein
MPPRGMGANDVNLRALVVGVCEILWSDRPAGDLPFDFARAAAEEDEADRLEKAAVGVVIQLATVVVGDTRGRPKYDMTSL